MLLDMNLCYGKFNSMPGFGTNVTWNPTSSFRILTNDYYGANAAGIPSRKRFHSDNSALVRYYNNPASKGISRMAVSVTGDIGFERGGGVNGFKNGDPFKAWDCSTNFDWMPNQSFTVRVEYVHRHASVPYFAGRGGLTSPNGYATTPLPPDWRPDLVKSEDRVILAILFRL